MYNIAPKNVKTYKWLSYEIGKGLYHTIDCFNFESLQPSTLSEFQEF